MLPHCVCVCVSVRVRKLSKKMNIMGCILAFEHVYVHVCGVETLLESLEDIAFPVWLLKAEARIRPGPKFAAAQLSHHPDHLLAGLPTPTFNPKINQRCQIYTDTALEKRWRVIHGSVH